MFTHTYEIRYGDYKDFDRVKVSSLLDMVQDVSTKHSTDLGYGIDKLRDLGVAWLIQGISIRLMEPVSTDYPLELSTGVKSVRGATSERCSVARQNGRVVAETAANWFLFDINTGRIARIGEEMAKAYPIEAFDMAYTKPAVLPEARHLYTIRVSNKEIDTNGHMNNQKSAELLMDALPFEYEFDEAHILYKKPAYLGDILTLCCAPSDEGYYVHLKNRDGEICVAGTFLKRR